MSTPAQNALIGPGEDSLCTELESLYAELSPATVLERNLFEEIVSALGRLRRCRLAESTLTAPDDDAAARRQTSIDRDRAQASRLLYKATAELRRLQTERQYRNEVLPEGTPTGDLGVCDFEKVVRTADHASERSRRLKRKGIEDYFTPLPKSPDFTKQTQTAPSPAPETPPETARNAACPCGSGQKYKRCCGENAPPKLHAA